MLNSFTFNGTNSREFGVYISGNGRITVPEKAYDFQSIPGRNGDLIVSRAARVVNDVITYPAFISPFDDSGIPRSYSEMAAKLRAWLFSVKGYAVLSDTYDPIHYRLAAFAGPIEFETLPNLRAGTFEIPFNCKPQRYRPDNEDAFALAIGETKNVESPAYAFSEPLIAVTCTGSFAVGDQTITIADNTLTGPIYIDNRLMSCYDAAGVNANRFVSFSDYEFPVIEDGTTVDAGTVALEVKPRWYEL